MEILDVVRMLIADKDPLNQLFTDDELTYFIEKNTSYSILQAHMVSTNAQVFEYPDVMVVRVYKLMDVNKQDYTSLATFNFLKHRITLSQPVGVQELLLECEVLDTDNLRADIYETLASDFRKLSAYAIQNVNGNLDTAKEHLLRMSKYFRKPKVLSRWD